MANKSEDSGYESGLARGWHDPGDDLMCDFPGDGAEADGRLCVARPSHTCDQCGRDTCTSHWHATADLCVDCAAIWAMHREAERGVRRSVQEVADPTHPTAWFFEWLREQERLREQR